MACRGKKVNGEVGPRPSRSLSPRRADADLSWKQVTSACHHQVVTQLKKNY